tara:strand:- start:166 stop:966 length:801 start_codon:yes stop_codon:yes gene_type:complete
MTDEQLADLLPQVIALARQAGKAIMDVYAGDNFGTTFKADNSPLTKADLASHRIITETLGRLAPCFPVLSEESPDTSYETRRSWTTYWLVDPLDGTKEFLARNNEFTVNIALIGGNTSVLGVVSAPALGVTYCAARGYGAFKQFDGDDATQIFAEDRSDDPLRMVVSRSHRCEELEAFLNKPPGAVSIPTGSSLKFCVVAEGAAHLYPRFGPTNEWDTAAAHCVVTEAGGTVTNFQGTPLVYNKPELLNPHFMVSGKRKVPWQDWL